jgi:hypothetical protein
VGQFFVAEVGQFLVAVDSAPEVIEIENSLDVLQRAVGGHIEVVKVGIASISS